MLPALTLQAPPTRAQGSDLQPQVFTITHHDTSAPLRTLHASPARPPRRLIARLSRLPPAVGQGQIRSEPDEALDLTPDAGQMPSPLGGWDGIHAADSFCNCLPPDPNGDVGPNHYVQAVNLALEIWSKDGTSILGPIPNNTLFAGFGGVCETSNDGDPILLYDSLADRWFFSQFALPNYPTPPFYQCIAVSTSGDPTDKWYRYEFRYPNRLFNDYGKWGVWSDGYYMTANQFHEPDESWAGTGALAFERSKMLQGDAPQVLYFNLGRQDPGGMLPSDVDGPPPPPKTPNYFVEIQDRGWDPVSIPRDRVMVWAFQVNWDQPVKSTFTNIARLPSKNFDANFCNVPPYACIPQKDTSARLDAIVGNTMYRLAYRNFGNHASLVTNLTVDVGQGRAGVRWYELRIAGGAPSIYQQSTFAPGSRVHRWIGSAAMDQEGNLAIGFSASANNRYPSIRYAGRLATDPLNRLTQGGTLMKAGSGSQLSDSGRWGDYSMLAVDPEDNCTFWYTNEYYSGDSIATWRTWIGKFKFANCS